MRVVKNLCRAFAAALCVLTFQMEARAAGPDPVEQAKPMVTKIADLLASADFKSLPREAQFDRFLAVARERFDFDEMSKRVLGPQWNSLSAEQKGLFNERFTTLLGYTYMGKLSTYNGEQINYAPARRKGDRAEVPTSIRFSDGKTLVISYIMRLKGCEWMAYDIVAENISLVHNYMEQLRSILQKNGFDGLIGRLNEKIEEMKAKDR